MEKKEYFTLTDEHLCLLKNAEIRWQNIEMGAPGIDSKRPYGGGQVDEDVCGVLGWEMPDEEDEPDDYEEVMERALEVHEETLSAMQILLTLNGAEPGKYCRRACKYNPGPWEKYTEKE